MDNPNNLDKDCQEWPINTNFEEIFNQSPIGIFFYDKTGKLTNANDSALYIARIPKLDDVLGTNIFDNPKIASKKEELHEKGLIKFQDSLDLIKIKEQNIYNPLEPEIIDIDWTVSVTDSGYLIQLQDITEHKKADGKLRESERHYKEIFNSMNEMFQVLELIYDDNGKVVDYYYRDVNPAFEQLTGKSREQLIDKKVKDIFGIVEDYWIEAYDKVLKTGKPRDFVNYGAELDKYYDVHIWKIKENQVAVIFNDITEHKKSEEKTKWILENIAESYVEYDNEWRYADVNSKYEETFGQKRNEIIGKVVWELLPQTVDSLQYKELHKAKKENIPVRFESKSLVSGDWFEANAIPLPEGLTVYLHNITERKKAEEELKRTEETARQRAEELEILMDMVPAAIFVSEDPHCLSIVGNKEANRMYEVERGIDVSAGTTEGEVLNLERRFFKNGKELKPEELPMQASVKKGENVLNYEMDALLPSGRMITMFGNANPLFDDKGKVRGCIGVYVDITDLKQAERALNQSKKLLQDIIDGFPSPIFVKDTEGRFLTINKNLEELLGVKNEELIGKTDFDIVTTELADYYRVNDQKVIEEGKAIAIEEEADLIDGHHTFIANKFPIYDSSGEPYGVGSISIDITERKLLEEKMETTMNELKRSNEELERFAYVSSHDLQEPLRMVTLYSQLLERRYKDSLDSDADDFIEYIVENAKRMKQLIDDLLEYSRVTGQAKEFRNVDLEKILDVVFTDLSVSISENNVKVNHEPLPTVFGDENQLLQVFQNLITNAIKFRGKNSPEINISTEKGQTEWIFSVSDNGIGINPEHQKQIFEVFKRLHTREEYPGTGIGLSIVQKIIIHHSGRIGVESELGKGTTFYFTIPINK